jgi:hypothetical protein
MAYWQAIEDTVTAKGAAAHKRQKHGVVHAFSPMRKQSHLEFEEARHERYLKVN